MHHLGGPLVLFDNGELMRERVLQSSAVLFAMNGYEAVSIKQIAEHSGVSSRRIYHLYADKLDLLEAMLLGCSEALLSFYAALKRECEHAATFRKVLENIFVELIDITNEFTYFALCAAHQLQFHNELAHRVYCGEFLVSGVETLAYVLDRAVERGLVAPFDTQATASLISSSVIVGNDIRAGQLAGREQVVDLAAWYTAQMNLISAMTRCPERGAAEQDLL